MPWLQVLEQQQKQPADPEDLERSLGNNEDAFKASYHENFQRAHAKLTTKGVDRLSKKCCTILFVSHDTFIKDTNRKISPAEVKQTLKDKIASKESTVSTDPSSTNRAASEKTTEC